MRICILYFSGTGGTANLSDIFKKYLEELGHTVDLVRIKHDTVFDLKNYDLYGIGAPVYSYRAPRIVTQILGKLNFHQKSFFVFSTIGGQKGNTHWNLYKAVRETAGACLGEFTVEIITNIRSWRPNKRRIMPKYFINTYDENRTKEFVDEIFNNLEYEVEKIPKRNIALSIFTSLFSRRWQMGLTAGIKQVDKKKCTKCGLCANEICPSGAITLNSCPVDAIWAYKSKNHHQYNAFRKYIIGFNKKKE
jgi:flavodoxin/NAD-dependent dihydropyrimidine dehydrogenase PreA subunit